MSETTLQNGYYYGDVSQTNGEPVPNTAPALVIAAGDTDLIAADTSVFLGGQVDNAGTLAMGGTTGHPAYLYINGGAVQGNVTYDTVLTLEGGGTVLLSDTADGNFIGEPNAFTGAVLINVDNTITGAGQFENFHSNNGVAVTNESAGIIDASGLNPLIVSESAIVFPLVNDGRMEATNNGGLLFINQQIVQVSSGTILAAGAGDNVYLEDNSDINGGVLQATGGGSFVAALSDVSHDFGDTLDGSTAAVVIETGTNLVLEDGLVLNLLGTIENQGTIVVAGVGGATEINLEAPDVTLTGGGTVVFSDSANNKISNANNGNLINADNIIAGAGVFTSNGNSGGFGITNQSAGVIDGTGTLNAMVLQSASYVNAGLVEATGLGGLELLSATLDQSGGGTLAAVGAGDNVYLDASSVIGGTLASRNGGIIHAVVGAHEASVTLDGSTAAVHIALGTDLQADDAEGVNLLGTIYNAGSILLAGTGDSTGIVAGSATVALRGGGQVFLSDNAQNYISGNGELINIDNIISGAGSINGISNAAAGVIEANGTVNALIIGGSNANAGMIEAAGTGGLEVLSATVDQSGGGTLAAVGAGDNVYLDTSSIIGGTLASSGGGAFHAVAGSHDASATLDGSTAAVHIAVGTDVQVDDGEALNLLGTIYNAGSIVLAGTADSTILALAGGTEVLQGSGIVSLGGAGNSIGYGNEGDTLVNAGNTILGVGQIGDYFDTYFTNQAAGIVDASSSNGALVLNDGAYLNENDGLFEATGGGSLDIFRLLTIGATGTVAAFGTGGVIFDGGSNLLNDSAGTLSGGTYIAAAAGGTATVSLAGGQAVSVDAADIILSGTNAAFTTNGAGLQSSLTEVSTGTLQIDSTSFDSAQMLKVDASGWLFLANGTLSGGLTNEGTIFGYGTISTGIDNSGAIVADGGTLTLSGAVDTSGTLYIDYGAGLELGAGSPDAIDFNSADIGAADLIIDAASQSVGSISGFSAGDTIILDGFTEASFSYVSGAGLEISDDATTITLDIAGTFSTGSFGVTPVAEGTEILLCYLRGTRIMTPSGEVPVEELHIGDPVVTRFGGTQTIKWIGRQSFGNVFVHKNRAQIPVRIAAGALGRELPKRDLYISPGHSMLLGGILVLAQTLLNGVTITQAWGDEDIHYYQLEFEAHDCVLAEGAWSESFADGPGMRGIFHNAAAFYETFPAYRAPDQFSMCAPRPQSGPALEAALRPVLALADPGKAAGSIRGWIDHADGEVVEGWAVDAAAPAYPVSLDVVLGDWVLGTTLACGYREDLAKSGFRQGWCRFLFPLPENFPLSARRHLQVRRAGGGAGLPMTAQCLQGLGIGAENWRLAG
jgi:hypothetical protein